MQISYTHLLKVSLLVLLVTILGCKKENGSKLPVIKGIQKRDINASAAGVEGTPNTKTSREGDIIDEPEVFVYPNPARGQLDLSIKSDNATQVKVRMVKGRYKPGNFGPDNILGIGLNIPIDQAYRLAAGRNRILLDLANVKSGYYRLYVEFDTYTLWDNVKVEE